jgi:hypothetical protein
MKQKLPLELAPGSLLRKAGVALLTFLFPSAYGPLAKYRPQDHYMRGPGPKWRAKHLAQPVTPAQQATAARHPETVS